ncbi:MAG TPA: response regulator transcription factor [Deltaproteobacteria bacterium]|nr:response regulator transcription factor [Deltaproteobacteria bacterium]
MRILVIEDEKKVAEFIRNGLVEEGYAVDAAFDGDAGFELASSGEYDAILLDVMLPRVDGVTLCAGLRAAGCDTPILMLTAKDAVSDKVRGLDAGADDYLTKPFAFEELLARIRALLRKKYQHQATRLAVDDLVLDTATHTVTRAGEAIPLSVKEYALLEYLMRNAGSVVTRTMISEHVWDISFETFTNVIDVYISYLRNKIDKGRPRALIQTVRGRGYTLRG